jgi:hypothetical protein
MLSRILLLPFFLLFGSSLAHAPVCVHAWASPLPIIPYVRENEQVAECVLGRYNGYETSVAYLMQQVLYNEEKEDDRARVAALYSANTSVPL